MPSENALTIAVSPGDGIGVDVTHEAVRVLRAVTGPFFRCTLTRGNNWHEEPA
jgi:isocitrate/isopropylmalate dehydrogenase